MRWAWLPTVEYRSHLLVGDLWLECGLGCTDDDADRQGDDEDRDTHCTDPAHDGPRIHSMNSPVSWLYPGRFAGSTVGASTSGVASSSGLVPVAMIAP